jgi:hypothetical protein
MVFVSSDNTRLSVPWNLAHRATLFQGFEHHASAESYEKYCIANGFTIEEPEEVAKSVRITTESGV